MGVIFMYDTTRFLTIKHLDEWMEMLRTGLEGEELNIPLLLVGGKNDLKEDKSVDSDYVRNLGQAYHFYDFLECSSMTGENVEYIFLSLALKMLQKTKVL